MAYKLPRINVLISYFPQYAHPYIDLMLPTSSNFEDPLLLRVCSLPYFLQLLKTMAFIYQVGKGKKLFFLCIFSHQASHSKFVFLSFLQPNKVKSSFSFQNLYEQYEFLDDLTSLKKPL